jgi:L,D-transpeptidase YbiS
LIDDQLLSVDTDKQIMTFWCLGVLRSCYRVSTSKYGLGELVGSYKTPRGQHTLIQKIGGGMPLNAVFKGRVFTGDCYNASEVGADTEDYILSRILWLSGCEFNNQFYPCSTRSRYIYIHGTPESRPLGIPLSIGCIRMSNTDIVSLFDMVVEGCKVNIC